MNMINKLTVGIWTALGYESANAMAMRMWEVHNWKRSK